MPLLDAIREALPVREPVLVFALAMWAILLAPLLARRMRVPEIIGLILAGVVLGEHGLNILARDDTMILLGTVGLLYIMFLAGLEIDLHQFVAQRRHSLIFGLLTFAIPMFVGTVMALWLLDFTWPASLLLASMFASHTLVGYPVVTRLGITRNPAVTASIGGTIITDTLALLVLAIIAAAATGYLTTWFWIRTGAALALFGVVVLMGIPPLARHYFHKHSDHGVMDFVFVLAVAFLAAYLAQLAGVEAIIGAFLGGLALNRSIPSHSPLMHRVQFTGNALFVPIFLLSVGMLVNVEMIFTTWHVWVVGGAMVITVLATKWLAAWVTQRVLGFSRDEGRVMFGLSVAQAAATLAAVFVGYRIGLFGEEVLNGSILMILVTCMVGPAFVDRFGRRVALHEEMEPLKPGDTPLRILIPLANPGSAPALMDLALMIRRPHSPEPVYPLTVADQSGDVEKQVASGERMLGHAVFYATSAGVPVQPVTRVDTNIASGISRAVAELRISTVVIGWTGTPSKKRFALGSVLDQLLRDNLQSVLVCRLLHPLNTTRRIFVLVPPLAEREKGFGEMVRTVKLMASRLGAPVLVQAIEREIVRLEPNVQRIRPAVPTEFHPCPAQQLFAGEIIGPAPGRDDLVILVSVREGRLAWSANMKRLPLLLAERYSESNLVLFYPPEQDIGATMASGPIGLLDASRTYLHMPSMPFSEAVERMITPHFGSSADVVSARQALEYMAEEAPTEIAPGMVMVHAHIECTDQPMLFMATSTEGIVLRQGDKPVQVLFLLASPLGFPAEDHLRTLAAVARMIHRFEGPEPLMGVENFEELREELTREK